MTWDYTKKEYKKQAKSDPVWHLERQIKYGLEAKEKINKHHLKKYLPMLRIPLHQKTFLQLFVNETKPSHSGTKKRH